MARRTDRDRDGNRILSETERRLVEAVLVESTTKAAIEKSGLSQSAGNAALRRPHVRAALARARAARRRRVEVEADHVLRAVLRVLDADPRRAFDKDGRPLPVHQLPVDVALALQGVEVGGKVGTRLKFSDRLRAAELLGRHLGILGEERGTEEDPLVVQVVRLGPDPGNGGS